MPMASMPGYPVLVGDVVCGRIIDEGSSDFMVRFEGKVFRFCSETCQNEFQRDPTRFTVKPR
jgi:YHS domain-containing protein